MIMNLKWLAHHNVSTTITTKPIWVKYFENLCVYSLVFILLFNDLYFSKHWSELKLFNNDLSCNVVPKKENKSTENLEHHIVSFAREYFDCYNSLQTFVPFQCLY